jgi:hypothetical protein
VKEMPRQLFRVTQEHKASYSYSLIAETGDEAKVGNEDPEMPGWYWCTDVKGVNAWVPKTYLEIYGDTAVFNQPYNSVEHNAQPGEIMQYLGEALGWVECLNKEWKYGWIPAEKLEKIGEMKTPNFLS